MIADVACGQSHIVSEFWSAADAVVLITTADSNTVMSTYAALKVFGSRETTAALRLVANQMEDLGQAQDVVNRIAESAVRFLGLSLELLGWLPFDRELAAGHQNNRANSPPVAGAQSPAFSRMAARLIETIRTSAVSAENMPAAPVAA